MSASCNCGAAVSNCQNCATIQLHDPFTSVLGGYTDSTCGNTHTFTTWTTSAGSLTLAEDITAGQAAVHTQSITVPALNGLCIAICANLFPSGGGANLTFGLTIGSCAYGFYRPAVTNFAVRYGSSAIASSGCVVGTGTFTTGGSALSNGDTVTLVVKDTSSGAGTYSITLYKNASAQITATGAALSLTAGSTIQVGFAGNNGGVDSTFGGKWQNAYWSTS